MKKHCIKIPANVSLFYSEENKILTFQGPLGKKSLRLKTKIIVSNNTKIIKITSKPFQNISKNDCKKLKILQGTIVTILKYIILSVSVFLYKKLKLIGVGYRVFLFNNLKNKFLQFKLGYSHNIYFKLPKNLTVFCVKFDKIFLKGKDYFKVFQIISLIRSYKKPEPYKGKGILYENEKINLKEGKKL